MAFLLCQVAPKPHIYKSSQVQALELRNTLRLHPDLNQDATWQAVLQQEPFAMMPYCWQVLGAEEPVPRRYMKCAEDELRTKHEFLAKMP